MYPLLSSPKSMGSTRLPEMLRSMPRGLPKTWLSSYLKQANKFGCSHLTSGQYGLRVAGQSASLGSSKSRASAPQGELAAGSTGQELHFASGALSWSVFQTWDKSLQDVGL